MSGKIYLIHGDSEADDPCLGLIWIRVWVINENDAKEVTLKPSFNEKTRTFTVKVLNSGTNNIYHETIIQYPRTTTSTSSLKIEAPSTSLQGEGLDNLFFTTIRADLTNGAIALETLRADSVNLETTNGGISGTYQAGHIDCSTSNGHITVKLDLRDARDGKQSMVTTKTVNASVDVQVKATRTTRGLKMKSLAKNGNVKVDALIEKADRGSYVKTESGNGKIDFNLNAGKSQQPLEVVNLTSNGAIESTVVLPPNQYFSGLVESSNAPVKVELKGEFEGRFDMKTYHDRAVIEGQDLELEQDDESIKRGYRVRNRPSSIKVLSTNGPTTLRFLPSPSCSCSASDKQS
ncbi:hypothetical protein EDD21DRAFT_411683 [Dissophora ornata]|nr:hypothetical protein EDD21DRAFT_411683 [Dissophora ornata]